MKTKLISVFSLQPSAFVLLASLALIAAIPRASAQTDWGQCLVFDGVDDYVRAGDVPLTNTSFTIEAWARRDSSDTMDMIVVQGSGQAGLGLMFGFHWGWVGFVFDFYGDGVRSTDVDNVWHHWAGTYEVTSGVQCLYRDGVLLGTNVASYNGYGPLHIGRAPFDDPAHFAGKLDEVRIWNVARSAAEIRQHLSHPLTGAESNLVAYWNFDEASGTTAHDSTTNGYDGTLVDGPSWMTSPVPWGPAPVAEITSPQCPAWADLGKPMQFVVTGIDPENDLSYCDMGVDGPLVAQAGFNSTHSGATASFTYTFNSPGTHLVWFQAFDLGHRASTGAHCTVEVIKPPVNKSLKVLTFNTHLFEDSPVECIARCGGVWPEFNYEDGDRRWWTAAHVRSSGADIVALQEVWSYGYRYWLADTLDQGSPLYQYNCWWVEPTVNCEAGLAAYDSLLPACVETLGPLYLPSNNGDYQRRFNTLSPGLVLLSKYPLSNLSFQRFPTYYQNARPGDSEAWSDKGVLTAVADVAGTPIRIGISHALTGAYEDWHLGSWDGAYLTNPITAFQVGGESYLIALGNDGQARISHLEDYSCFDEAAQTTKHGGGWKHLYTNSMGTYDHLTSFQMSEHNYLLAQDGFDAHIYRINDDPSTGWTFFPTNIPLLFPSVVPFRMANHPYLLGLGSDSTAALLRINDDPATGWTCLYTNTWDSSFVVVPFESGGEPYFFSFFGPFYASARITKVNSDPTTGWTHLYTNSWEPVWNPNSARTKSFQLNGQACLLGLDHHGQARFTRINADPSTGWTHLSTNANWGTGCIEVVPFEMNGHPCFFGLLGCCGWFPDSTLARPQPWRAWLRRIHDNGQGWEELLQLECIRMIRDATVVDSDGPPAIMMGDFNVHPDNYAVMNEIFQQAGAVDAYTEVHGSAAGGETIDWFDNLLMQYFWPTTNYSDPKLVSRIDYVYVKPAGNGLWLEPINAYVRRDWTHVAGKDLSDHYPLFVDFRLQEASRLEASPLAGGRCQLSITGTMGRLCEVQYSPDHFTWNKLAEFRIADSPHLFVDPTPVTTGARFYRLRLLP